MNASVAIYIQVQLKAIHVSVLISSDNTKNISSSLEINNFDKACKKKICIFDFEMQFHSI
jgi:ribosomal protein L33